MSDAFTERIFLEYNGDELEIYPMIIQDKDIVTSKLSRLYNEQYWYLNLFDEQAHKTLMELLYIALGRQFSQLEIESKVDIRLSLAIIKKFKEVSQLKDKENDKKSTEWKQLYAALLQNTSMNMQDILQLTIGQLEELLDGIAANNRTQGTGSKDTYEGLEAIKAMAGKTGF